MSFDLMWKECALLITFMCPHCSVEAVGHELALAVRGDERDGTVVLKAWQTNTLMKLHILQLHCLALLSWHKHTHKDWELCTQPWGNQGQGNDDWQTFTSSLSLSLSLRQTHTESSVLPAHSAFFSSSTKQLVLLLHTSTQFVFNTCCHHPPKWNSLISADIQAIWMTSDIVTPALYALLF